MADPIEIAWAAGLFEGEGCLTKAKRSPHLNMTQTDGDVMERFHRIVGQGYLSGPHDRPGCKPFWRWGASGNQAMLVIDLFMPLFGVRRRSRALELLEWRAALIAEATAPRACPTCGSIFSPDWGKSTGRRQIYCTPACRLRTPSVRRGRNARHLAAHHRSHRERKEAMAPRACRTCETPLPTMSRANKVYCSQRCCDVARSRRVPA